MLGREKIIVAENQQASATQATVVKLLDPLCGKNHRVYMDNFYTSIPLFNQLLKMEIFATGTVRTNRIRGLTNLSPLKNKRKDS
jgi:hypothetical protein